MFLLRPIRLIPASTILLSTILCSSLSSADDMVSFATGGYASGLRTMSQMRYMDTNGDGIVSKAEWLAYHERLFSVLDKYHSGQLNEKQFLGPSQEMATFATGGYARGLQNRAMMHKIDTDGDGKISHDEYIAYQTKIFDMMDTKQSGSLGPQDFLGK
jgi:Ca2+-binding EF-hand superfamily protein